MDGYNPTGMPYIGNPMSYTDPVSNDSYLQSLPALGLPDHNYQQQHHGYSTDDFGSNTTSSLPLPIPPETERQFTNPYDDFQYDTIQHPEAPDNHEQPVPDSNTSVDRDDELLSFHPPTYNFILLDNTLNRTSISLNARLHGMFFMADPPSTPGLYPQMTLPELTCYRRNLFQVTGSITLPRSLRYIMTEQGERMSIVSFELVVTATESVEGHPVKLISVPWKTPVNNAPPVPEDKTEKEPTSIPLDIMSNQDMDSDYATFPIAWKRLQFRIATANNGRRKELQQHFVAKLRLMATLQNGVRISIAEARSAAIVVRGRSPRNFQQRKDQAVGEKSVIRKGPQSPAIPTPRATTDTTPSRSPLKRERGSENPFASSLSFSVNDPHSQNSSNAHKNGWHKPSGASSAPLSSTPTFRTPTLPSSKSNNSSASPPSVPQPLPLTNDFDAKRAPSQRPTKLPRKNSSNSNRPHPYQKHPSLPSPRTMLSTPAQPQKFKSEGQDPADRLYEYFPLGADDWQKPVDAVYRPHMVHHIAVTAGGMGGRPSIGGRSSKYFSGDVA